ncbi:hypothetical protein E4656_13800 [Natronospirillum operosum]|uniref:Lipoprotein n=1 Tax=Natronospirillum operosum TaxID=2759953 RepID=A0A4Z0W923_9GAMM|nr:hypothetical protein [Natronospirillum operosum]TGG92538.1 hypothetical protein E4656_13800 [Natronospirillum operosum]
MIRLFVLLSLLALTACASLTETTGQPYKVEAFVDGEWEERYPTNERPRDRAHGFCAAAPTVWRGLYETVRITDTRNGEVHEFDCVDLRQWD